MKVYRSNRVEALAEALVEVLRRPSGDPTAREVVVVHSTAMERWLSMRIADRLGICAQVDFPFPTRLVHRAFAAVLGVDTDALEAWTPGRLAWSVLAALPDHLDHPAFAPLRGYLHDRSGRRDAAGRRRVQLARRIADVFDRYLTFRPDMVRRWDAGRESEDEAGWQPILWRAVRARVGTPHIADLTARFRAAMGRPRARLDGFPPRVCLFGIATLPPFYVEVFAALARHREVHLFAHGPSREYWADTRSPGELARLGRRPGEDHWAPAPPLLAAFGRLARDFQEVLLDCAPEADEPGDGLFVEPPGDRLIGRLQADMLHLRARGTPGPGAAEPLPADPADDSIAVHACHGPMRQVEVLRDTLLDLFVRHPDLEPRDVVVMTPDIETYAPLIEAVFADGRRPVPEGGDAPPPGGDPGFPAIPFRIADRSLRSINPVAEAFLRVLGLARGRATASEILDLLSMEPVRRRFGIPVEALPTIHAWVADASIRWGVDAEHRARHGQPPDPENTWRFGLDRLLLGHALPGEGRRLFGGVLPYDDIEGAATDLLGRFVDFCETLFGHLRRLRGHRAPAEWRRRLRQVLADLLRDPWRNGGQAQQVRDALDALVDEAEAARFAGTLDLEAVASLLDGRFGMPLPAQGFFTGGVTFCAMVPMRSIPFRVVCLLGLDDGAFPRPAPRLGFDLAAARPRVGDRNPRDDDRYLFLEALLAARDHLVITYTGRDIRSNEPLPPAVPVGELLDAVEAGFRLPDGRSLRSHLVVEHPLQPFSPRCFGGDPAATRAPTPSFDRRFLAAARRLGERSGAPPVFIRGPLPPPATPDDPPTVALDDLVRFFWNPARFLLRARLGVVLEEAEPMPDDREPIVLDGRQIHALGTDLLTLGLDGVDPIDPADPNAAYPPLRASGRLPPGVPGRCAWLDLAAEARPLVRRVDELRATPPRDPIEVDARIGGVRLIGRLGPLHETGLLFHQFGHVRARHRLALWLRHLALSLAAEGFASRLVGRGARHPEVVTLPPVDRATAGRLLADLVALYRAGLVAPLPFFPETSLAYARAAAAPDPRVRARAREEAARRWKVRPPGRGEADDPYVARLFGDARGRPFDGPNWHLPGLPFPPGRAFHDLALAVWTPYLAHAAPDRA